MMKKPPPPAQSSPSSSGTGSRCRYADSSSGRQSEVSLESRKKPAAAEAQRPPVEFHRHHQRHHQPSGESTTEGEAMIAAAMKYYPTGVAARYVAVYGTAAPLRRHQLKPPPQEPSSTRTAAGATFASAASAPTRNGINLRRPGDGIQGQEDFP